MVLTLKFELILALKKHLHDLPVCFHMYSGDR